MESANQVQALDEGVDISLCPNDSGKIMNPSHLPTIMGKL